LLIEAFSGESGFSDIDKTDFFAAVFFCKPGKHFSCPVPACLINTIITGCTDKDVMIATSQNIFDHTGTAGEIIQTNVRYKRAALRASIGINRNNWLVNQRPDLIAVISRKG